MSEQNNITEYHAAILKNQELMIEIIKEVSSKAPEQPSDDTEKRDLRRYFAAAALPSCYSGYVEHAKSHGWDENWHYGVAKDAFMVAEAMIKVESEILDN